MTHVSCSSCRLRFTRALAAYLAECPLCGGLLDRSHHAESILGLPLFDADQVEPQVAPHGSAPTPDAPAPWRPPGATSVHIDP